jgi:hypothetical protein
MQTSPTPLRLSHPIDRLALVLFSPKRCWATIMQEQYGPKDILLSTVLPLLIMGAICSIAGHWMFLQGTGYLPTISSMALSSTLGCLLSVALLFVGAWLVQKLAGLFKGAASFRNAFSLIAHAELPLFAGSLFGIYPPAAILALPLAAVSVYCFFQGVLRMTTVPTSKRLGFTVLFIAVYIIFSTVLSVLTMVVNLSSMRVIT